MKYLVYVAVAVGAVYLFYMASGSRSTCSFTDWITQKCGA
jgi:hypothetical protein